jgi:kinetochore protein Mis13/DSN1
MRKTRKSLHHGDIATDFEMPLQVSDTPVIRKNKEMRSEQQRRSSMGMRGQRASSSLGKGDISELCESMALTLGVPHDSVPSSLFYRHINQAVPEPVRAKHLLVFCAKRATDTKLAQAASTSSKGKEREPVAVEADRMTKDIMDEFMASMGKGKIPTNVFGVRTCIDGADDQDGPLLFASALPMKPHPKNVENQALEAKINKSIERYVWPYTVCSELNRPGTRRRALSGPVSVSGRTSSSRKLSAG